MHTFKVGDRVRGKYSSTEYTGTVADIKKDELYVRRDSGGLWACKIFPDGRVGAALGLFDGHYLELIDKPNKRKPEPARGELDDEALRVTEAFRDAFTGSFPRLIRLRSDGAGKKMSKLNTLARKLFDADTRVLVEAGVLDDDLSIRDEEFVLSFVVGKYKAELAKEARAKLRREKRADKDEE